MIPVPLSIIVVSRHRTEALRRCITALMQQDHPNLELIVVADGDAVREVGELGLPIKCVTFDEENISAARNLGLAQAAAEVVAFIDDDAVAEPTWAARIAAPFADAEVTQAGGFVRGRGGLGYQWRALEVDATGVDHVIEVPDGVSLRAGSAARAVKTQGTNSAFRAAALAKIGGFDPAYRFFLEDADVNLRLAAKGGLTAIVPGAEVQHGYEASVRRRSDRVPVSLHDIGASSAVFLRRHVKGNRAARLAEIAAEQRARLVRFMVEGWIEPRDVGRLLATFREGVAAGKARPLGRLEPVETGRAEFLRFPTAGARPGVVLSGWVWQRRALAARARAARQEGRIVTLLTFGPSPRRHLQRFDSEGIWWQDGGVHGRSEPLDRFVRFWRQASRREREIARISRVRPTK